MARYQYRASGRVTLPRVLVFLIMGLLTGAFLGWLFIGTAHAILEGRTPRSTDQTSQSPSKTLPTGTDSTKPLVRELSPKLSSHGIHVLMTSGGGPYQNFQSRIMYGTYKLVQNLPGGEHLVGFTRILHRVDPDRLMDEIPTFHATPLNPSCDRWCDFPPASRPDAVRQFFDAARRDASMIKGPWVFMTECDYVWIKPLMSPGLASDTTARAIAFPFGYIQPTYPTVTGLMRKWYPVERGPLGDIPGTGPAPALMRLEEWLRIMPDWERITAEIEASDEAREKLGWVREMYAFSLACALQGVKVDVQLPPKNRLMVQPPADHTLGDAAIMHYTWGTIVNDTKSNKEVWRFEKREYTLEEHELRPPKLPEPPPFQEGWKLQDGVPVTKDLRDTLHLMIRTMNTAIDTLKPLS